MQNSERDRREGQKRLGDDRGGEGSLHRTPAYPTTYNVLLSCIFHVMCDGLAERTRETRFGLGLRPCHTHVSDHAADDRRSDGTRVEVEEDEAKRDMTKLLRRPSV